MSVTNFIQGGSGGSVAIPTSQPVDPGFWNNSGVLTYWDGSNNQTIDFKGDTTDVFGNQLQDV